MMNLTGEFIWVKLIFNRIDTGNDEDFCFLFMVEDIHESHARLMADLKKYENLARIDSLTGIANHGKIEQEIKSSIEKCQKEHRTVALIMFDIDHFKNVNDTYGHSVGDYVLKIVAGLANEFLTASFGVIEIQEQENAQMAFKRVDAALYNAKNTGRNKVMKG